MAYRPAFLPRLKKTNPARLKTIIAIRAPGEKSMPIVVGLRFTHFALVKIIDVTAARLALVVAVNKNARRSRTTTTEGVIRF